MGKKTTSTMMMEEEVLAKLLPENQNGRNKISVPAAAVEAGDGRVIRVKVRLSKKELRELTAQVVNEAEEGTSSTTLSRSEKLGRLILQRGLTEGRRYSAGFITNFPAVNFTTHEDLVLLEAKKTV
ncbi:hypothetical protein Dimus_006700 [Dionaea muscipula]